MKFKKLIDLVTERLNTEVEFEGKYDSRKEAKMAAAKTVAMKLHPDDANKVLMMGYLFQFIPAHSNSGEHIQNIMFRVETALLGNTSIEQATEYLVSQFPDDANLIRGLVLIMADKLSQYFDAQVEESLD